jgi:LacI family transcriptional regulator
MSDTQDGARRDHSTPTIRDVARLAEVSIGTASKAMNALGRMRQETRDKVMRVASEIGYRPNNLAQSLHRAHSMTVGIISNDSFGRFSSPIVEALEQRLAEDGIAVFMCNATDDPARERRHVEQLLGKRIDGLVVTARRADRRPPISGFSHLPTVYVYSQADDPHALSLVPDDEGGAMLAVSHLASLGRKRIACISGPERFEAVRLRHRGYVRALKATGLEQRHGFSLCGAWSEAWGREAIQLLFDGVTLSPDALFCGNDQIARGAIDALREMGATVPGDVAVVGFDNWEVMTAACRPPLSSIDMNLQLLGRVAGDRLIEMIAGKRHEGVHCLPCTLVVRESSAGTVLQQSEGVPK